MPGPDHKASIEPDEFARMVTGIREVEQALGTGDKRAMPVELTNRAVARKSLIAARPISAGEVITQDDLTAMRPANGLSPMEYWRVVGTVATRTYSPGELIEWPQDR